MAKYAKNTFLLPFNNFEFLLKFIDFLFRYVKFRFLHFRLFFCDLRFTIFVIHGIFHYVLRSTCYEMKESSTFWMLAAIISNIFLK